jgi:hypothetical protein
LSLLDFRNRDRELDFNLCELTDTTVNLNWHGDSAAYRHYESDYVLVSRLSLQQTHNRRQQWRDKTWKCHSPPEDSGDSPVGAVYRHRTSQSPKLVVGRWCGAKYGLAIALGNECQLVINDFDIAFFDALVCC